MSDARKEAPVTVGAGSRTGSPDLRVVRFAEFQFEFESRLLWRDGAEVPLAPRSAAVLAVFLDRAGKLVSKDELVDLAWRGAFVSETAIAEGVSQLRQALGDDAAAPRFIKTFHRRGYRFIAPVEVVQAPAADGSLPGAGPAAAVSWRRAVPLVAALSAIVVGGVWFWAQRTSLPPKTAPIRFDITFPPDIATIEHVVMSPTGRELAVVAGTGTETKIYLRRLDAPDLIAIPGGEGGHWPFFSPNGGSLGFFAGGKLWTATLPDGPPRAVCDFRLPTAAAWGPDDRIVVATLGPPQLWEVPARGGEPRNLASLDNQKGQWRISHPVWMPDGGLVASIWSTSIDDARIDHFDLRGGKRRTLLEGAARPSLAGGRLYYARADGLYSARWNRQGELVDEARSSEAVAVSPTFGATGFSAAGDGALAYLLQRPTPLIELLWAGPGGEVTPIVERREHLLQMRISPQGDKAAVVVADGGSQVWIYDLVRGGRERLTLEGFNLLPIWTPDGQRVCYGSRRQAAYDIYCQEATQAGAGQALVVSPANKYPSSWTPDGEWVFFVEDRPETGRDLWRHSPRLGRSEPFLTAPADQGGGRVSPDGRWIIFRSNESGVGEIFLDSYPAFTRRRQVAPGAAGEATWGDSGRRIVFSQDPGVTSVPFDPATGVLGPAERIFDGGAIAVQADPASRRVLVARLAPAGLEPPVIRWLVWSG